MKVWRRHAKLADEILQGLYRAEKYANKRCRPRPVTYPPVSPFSWHAPFTFEKDGVRAWRAMQRVDGTLVYFTDDIRKEFAIKVTDRETLQKWHELSMKTQKAFHTWLQEILS